VVAFMEAASKTAKVFEFYDSTLAQKRSGITL